ncbi:hypothetical protein [Solimonas fluminis]|uniref:hypothetical protein n=1 Tax=Solimonas fluminis TaxID=2086571 RepID=UPI001FAF579A|nr:hypothetical protein [Solimonas fluminis]
MSRLGAPLTIDAHCHVFNGSDLQIKEFLSRVAVRQRGALGIGVRAIGGLLETLAWNGAPDGDRELEMLASLEKQLAQCGDAEFANQIEHYGELQYTVARNELHERNSVKNPYWMVKIDKMT